MCKNKQDVLNFLTSLQRHDLATLLQYCDFERRESEIDNGFYKDLVNEAVITAPSLIADALKSLPDYDRKRVAQAVFSVENSRTAPEDIHVLSTSGSEVSLAATLISELIIHREMMISVATGGDRIQDVNDYYRARQTRVISSLPSAFEYRNQHDDLWNWYHYWSEQLPSYRDRRHYIRQLIDPVIEALSQRSSLPSITRQPTGWERVDRALAKARTDYDSASVEEDYQGIGLICREVIISLAQAVYDPSIHKTEDGVKPSQSDANRMIEAFVAHAVAGASNKEVRAHARASLNLALNLQHRRTATRQLAALCLEATSSTVSVISIIARGVDEQNNQ